MVGIESDNAEHWGAASEIWTRACGEAFALSPRGFAYNLRAPLGVVQGGRFAVVDGVRAGFVLASVLNGHEDVAPLHLGWVDAIAVAPEFQGRGVGSALIEWAHEWLRGQGRTVSRLCGSCGRLHRGLRWSGTGGGFVRAGMCRVTRTRWCRILGETCKITCRRRSCARWRWNVVRLTESDVPALRGFLEREFPGRWAYEFEQNLRDGANIADYMVLYSERGLDACCAMTFEDSVHRVERYYPSPLPRPWGQVGTIGVARTAGTRGMGRGCWTVANTSAGGGGVGVHY